MATAQGTTQHVAGAQRLAQGVSSAHLTRARARQGVLPGTGGPPVAHRGPGPVGPQDLWRPPAAQQLLARAGSELTAARSESDPAQRFLRAHLAALRAGAAVLAGCGSTGARGRPRAVWELLRREVPELGAWAAYFAAGAPMRAAVESGREPVISSDTADHVLTMAELFIEVIEGLPAVRAS